MIFQLPVYCECYTTRPTYADWPSTGSVKIRKSDANGRFQLADNTENNPPVVAMKTLAKLFILLVMSCCTSVAHAKSPCYTLATNAYFSSSLSPTHATRENLQDANEIMANAETFCKRMIQAVKTKKVTADELRGKATEALKAARQEFEKDGDADKLEFTEYMTAILKGSADMAE